MTVATDLAAAQAQFKTDFDQFKIDFSAAIAALRTAFNGEDEAAMEAEIANLQTMDTDLKGMDSTAAGAIKPPVVTPPPPSAPVAPVGVTVTPASLSNVIAWTSSAGATSFNIYWSLAPGVTTSSTQIKGATNPFTNIGLTALVPVFYAVTAVNATGESALSAEVSGTPTA